MRDSENDPAFPGNHILGITICRPFSLQILMSVLEEKSGVFDTRTPWLPSGISNGLHDPVCSSLCSFRLCGSSEAFSLLRADPRENFPSQEEEREMERYRKLSLYVPQRSGRLPTNVIHDTHIPIITSRSVAIAINRNCTTQSSKLLL